MLGSHELGYTATGPAPEHGLAAQYLRFILCNTVLTRVFGVDVAVDRALRVSLCAWNAIREDMRPPLYDFITNCFPHLSPERVHAYEQDGVPRCAIPFFLPVFTRDSPVYESFNVQHPWYHIMDIVAVDPSRSMVPSTLFIPYKTRSSQRCRQMLDRISSIPLWFLGEDGVIGLPVQNADNVRLLHGNDELRLNSMEKPIMTLKIKFSWPNYEPQEKQIRGLRSAPLNNLNRLAALTACAVRNFMSDETNKVMIDKSLGPHPWQIGMGQGEIRIENVLLLGVIFVSAGAAMPLLAVMNESSPQGHSTS